MWQFPSSASAAVLLAVVLVHGHAMAQTREQDHRTRSRSDRTPCRDKDSRWIQYVVDGITGEITSVKDRCAVFPGDTVAVTIRRANVLHYSYEVAIDSVHALVQTFGIVGMGKVGETPLGPSVDETDFKALLPSVFSLYARPPEKAPNKTADPAEKAHWRVWARVSPTMLASRDLLLQALDSLIAQRDTMETLFKAAANRISGPVSKVTQQYARLDAVETTANGTSKWSDSYKAVEDAFASSVKTPKEELEKARSGIGGLRDGMNKFRLRVALFNAACVGADTLLRLNLGEFPKLFDSLAVLLAASAQKTFQSLNTAVAAIDRWNAVIAGKSEPVLTVIFPVTRSNSRQYLSVYRRAVSEPSVDAEKLVAGSGGSPAPRGSTLTRLSYEGHGHSSFNISMGMVGVLRPYKREFGKAPSLRPDGRLEYQVVRTAADRFSFRPVVQLGVYLRRHDPLDPERRAVHVMATIGGEFAGNERDYYAGFAVDHRIGLTVGGGMSLYQATSLASGWEAGQVIPVDSAGAPLVAGPPTHTRRLPGLYLYLGFRPVIFEALGKAIGLISK